jgi:hypothetical protein
MFVRLDCSLLGLYRLGQGRPLKPGQVKRDGFADRYCRCALT